jgi:hypothetical protein
MDGLAGGTVSDHDRLGRFKNGNSEYAAKRRRIAERLAQLSTDYAASPSQQQLLAIAARHLDDAAVARTAERRVRATNAATRILRLIPRKEAPMRSMTELMAGVK